MMLSVAPLISNPPSRATKPFVLIVDDHEPTLRDLKALVEHAGYSCVAAVSAAEALIYCDQNRPTVVITDFSMPRLNGEGLARWLKARYPTTPILLVTGELLDSKAVAELEATFAAVINKPLQIETFLSMLNGLMAIADDRPPH